MDTQKTDFRVNRENGIIVGVSVISAGEAKGHDLVVDGITLDQITMLAQAKGKVPVRVNHGLALRPFADT